MSIKNALNIDTLCVSPLTPTLVEQAENLAATLSLPLSLEDISLNKNCLYLTPDYLAINIPALGNPIYIDFVTGKQAHRRLYGGGRGQPLARAIGLKKGETPSIIDATAGYGRDAFVLATLGCQVLLLEQNRYLVYLLQDALSRAKSDPDVVNIVNLMNVQHTTSHAYLAALSKEDLPDVIYMDPMYPSREKSSLVKKEMQLLHQLVGADETATDLLSIARQRAKKRVVVKRPKTAEFVGGQSPTASISSKNTRYDIYSTR